MSSKDKEDMLEIYLTWLSKKETLDPNEISQNELYHLFDNFCFLKSLLSQRTDREFDRALFNCFRLFKYKAFWLAAGMVFIPIFVFIVLFK